MTRGSRTLLLAFLLGAASAAAAAEKRPIGFEDIMTMRTVADPVVSPDGRDVLFTVTAWEPVDVDGGEASESSGKMESVSHLFRVEVAGGVVTQLTFGTKASKRGETSPAWSPDGRWISFLAAREEGSAKKANAGDGPKLQLWLHSD